MESHPWKHDLLILFCTSTVPLLLVLHEGLLHGMRVEGFRPLQVATEALKSTGRTSTAAARKFLHIATGLAFMCTWPLYSSAASARYLAAALPGLMALRFVLAGLGLTHEPKLVAGTARTGNRRELLGGPALYGVAHVVLTVCAWRSHPAGPAGIAALCAGDGLADVVGRRWGARGPLAGRLPHSRHKTWMGSLGCCLGACLAIYVYIGWFNRLGYFKSILDWQEIMLLSAISSIAATVCETLPGPDNITVPAAAAFASWYWVSKLPSAMK